MPVASAVYVMCFLALNPLTCHSKESQSVSSLKAASVPLPSRPPWPAQPSSTPSFSVSTSPHTLLPSSSRQSLRALVAVSRPQLAERSQGEKYTENNEHLSAAKTGQQISLPKRSEVSDDSSPKYSAVVKAAISATGSVGYPALLTRKGVDNSAELPRDEEEFHHLHDNFLDEHRTGDHNDSSKSDKRLYDDHLKSFRDDIPHTESLHSEDVDKFHNKDLVKEGALREVASVVGAVRQQELGQCALAITTDHHHLPALYLLLTQHLVGGDRQQQPETPVTVFTLPPLPQDGNTTLPSSLTERYRGVGRETCVHYVFLVSDPVRLLQLLAGLYQNALHLLAKFVLVTHLHTNHILDFLQASPVSQIVQVLLATPSAELDGEKLQLYTHLFFLDQQRISVKELGTWPPRRTYSLSNKTQIFQFFPEKLSNFHGFKLRATTFNHPPVSIFESRPDGTFSYDGLEIRLLWVLAAALNFTAEITQPRDGDKWGRRLADGSWTGAVGETVRGETDVSFANYFITADRLKVMDMTGPYYIDYTCFITPKPQPLPQSTAVAWPFHVSVWGAVVVSLVVVPPAVRVAGVMEPGTWFRRLDNAYWYVLGVFLTRSQPYQLVPSSSGLRVVVISSWVVAMVVSVAYKSSLIAFLLVPLPAQPVNTLAQLLESGLHWGVRDRGGWDEWFSNSLDPTSQKIAAGFQFVNGIERGVARVLAGDFAFMNSGTFLRYLVASNFTDEFGQTDLHIAKECFVPFRIGLGMPRFSVYTSRFNTVVGRVVEAGLVTRWFQDLLDKAERKQRDKARERQDSVNTEAHSSRTAVLTLYNIQGPFILLLLGWALAGTTFLLELLLCSRRGRCGYLRLRR